MDYAIINLNSKITLTEIFQNEILNKINSDKVSLSDYIENDSLFLRDDFMQLLDRKIRNLDLLDRDKYRSSFFKSDLGSAINNLLENPMSYNGFFNLERTLNANVLKNKQVSISKEDFDLTNSKLIKSISNNELFGFHYELQINKIPTAVYYVSKKNDLFEKLNDLKSNLVDIEKENIENARLKLSNFKLEYYEKFKNNELDINKTNPVLLNEFIAQRESEQAYSALSNIMTNGDRTTPKRKRI